MNVENAWYVLGKDWGSIVTEMRSIPDPESRVRTAESMLVEARKLAKRLMAMHHPDKNPGDSGAAQRFRQVNEALNLIESDTSTFRERHEALKARSEQRAAAGDFITIK